MKKVSTPLLLLLVAWPGRAQLLSRVELARWPEDRVAAVSLTFDDAMTSQLDNAVPILRKHDLKATFFVTTGSEAWRKRTPEWKRLAEEGNELGNHTVHHPCLLPEITPHSQDFTPESMRSEISDAARDITKVYPSHRGLTFAYPCGNMSFGPPQDQVRNAALYIRFVSEYAFAARGAAGGGAQNPDELSVLNVTDLGSTANKDVSQLLAMLQPGVREHQWSVYCFHGVGGEWLSISSETLDRLAAYLEQHREIWIATFGDVVRYIQERNATSVHARESGNSIYVELTWSMDPRSYDLPLTLRIQLPAGWKTGSASTGTKKIAAKLSGQTRQRILLVDVPAGTRALHIEGAVSP